MKRVKQISIDILVDDDKDGCVLAEQIARDLENEGNIVLGSSFQDDLTELYKRDYPELIKPYEFECNLSEEYQNYDCCDEWGAATLWLNDKQGVEYNFCIDNNENCCAIYKMYCDENEIWETDYSIFEHYEIDFDNVNWEEELEKSMYEVAKKFFESEVD